MALPQVGLEAVITNLSVFSQGAKLIGKSFDAINAKADAVTKGSSGLTKALTSVGKGILSVGAIAASAAAAGFAALTAGIVALGIASIKEGAAFTKAMSNVKAIAGATAEEFDALTKSAEDLGRTTKFTAIEAAEGQLFLARAGFEVTEVIEALPGVLNLAAAGNLELGRSADIVSNVLSGFGEDASQTGRFVDVLARVANTANTDVQGLGDGMAKVAPLAAELGLSVEETAVGLGILGDNAIKGGEGGTALRNALLSLSAPNAKATKLLDELGFSAFDLSTGKLKNLPTLFGDFNKALDGLSPEERVKALKQIGGRRGIIGLSILSKAGGKEIEGYVDRLDTLPTAAEVAATQLDNLSGDMTLLNSAFSGLKIDIFRKLEPLLRNVVKFATQMIPLIGPPLVKLFDFIAITAAPIIEGLQFVISEFFRGFEQGEGILDKVATGLLEVADSFIDEDVLFPLIDALENFFNIIFGGIDSIGNFGSSFGSVSDIISNVANFVLPLLTKALNFLGPVIAGVIGKVQKVIGAFEKFGARGAAVSILGLLGLEPDQIASILSIIDTVIETVTTFFKKVTKAFERFGARGAAISILGQLGLGPDQIASILSTVDTVINIISNLFATFSGLFDSFQEGGFSQVFTDIISGIPGLLNGIIETITTWATTQGPILQETFAQWSEDFWNWITPIINQAGQILAGIIAAIGAWATSAETQAKLAEMGKALGVMLVTGIENLFANQAAIAEVLLKIVAGLAAAVVVIGALLIGIGAQIVAGIIAGIIEKITGKDVEVALISNLGAMLSGIGNQIMTIAELTGKLLILGLLRGLDGAKNILKIAWKAITDFFKTNFENLVILTTDFVNEKIEFWQELFRTLTEDIIPKMWESIKTIFTTSLNAIKSVVSQKLDEIRNFFAEKFEQIKTIVSTVFNTIKTTISTIMDTIKGLIDTTIQAIVDTFDKLKEIAKGVKEAFDDAVGKVRTGLTNMINAVTNKISDFIQAGKDLIAGIGEGIDAGAVALVDIIKDAIQAAIDAALDLLGIGSPSKVFFDVGENVMLGLQQGLAAMTPAINAQFQASIVAPAQAAISGPVLPSIINNNITLNTGGNTINTSFDQAQFDTMVMRSIQRQLG